MYYFFSKNKPILISIFLSLIIIAVTYWYVQSRKENVPEQEENIVPEVMLEKVRGIQPDDHVLGNPNAPIVLIVFSDFSCPYCVDYHETIRTVMRTFGTEGKVAVVFRHMPYVQLHPEAPMYALASECVAQELGNPGFWKFADELFGKNDPLKPLTAAELVVLAEKVGATRQTFVACMRSNELMAEVEKDFQEAIDGGAKGTPYTIVEALGDRAEYQGAQSYRTLAVTIQTLSRSLEVSHSDTSSSEFDGTMDFSDEFENIEIGTSTGANATTSTSSQPSAVSSAPGTSSVKKVESLLDGIVD